MMVAAFAQQFPVSSYLVLVGRRRSAVTRSWSVSRNVLTFTVAHTGSAACPAKGLISQRAFASRPHHATIASPASRMSAPTSSPARVPGEDPDPCWVQVRAPVG